MIGLRWASIADGQPLSSLIFSSAPVLLPYLFKGRAQALDYIFKASQRSDGQYSAARHQIACEGSNVLGSITLWDNNLPQSFHSHTLQSLSDFLGPNQIAHLVITNERIKKVFLAPLDHQLCVGHLAVIEKYRGMGVGKKLIAHAIVQAKLRDKTQLILDVDSNNDDAVSFYLGLGFMLIKSNEFIYTKQTFYRMQYNL
ncbi:MAG: ribosomal protein S18 acetylase RimI-like enzyme [Alphaproteobacteria bacterium]|jgi:ribosomal protein S18 acetylase RimI-like enzyme